MALSLVTVAYAQSYTGVLYLDPIASKIKTGDKVVFSGILMTDWGHLVPGATIYIKDDVRFGSDNTIKRVTTNSDGEFSTTWTAKKRSSGNWDFYAIFEGSENISKVKSSKYSVNVSSSYASSQPKSTSPQTKSYTGILHLDPISSNVKSGDRVYFSGTLTTTSGHAVPSATIYIKDNVRLGSDDIIKTTKTNSNGQFSTTWTAQVRSSGNYDFYAEFKKSSNVSGAKSSQYSVNVSPYSNPQSKPSSSQTPSYTSVLNLERIPSNVKSGDRITFSGSLTTTEGYIAPGKTIYIKDNVRLGSDDVIKTITTDKNGRFSATWIAQVRSSGNYDFYAEFDGSGSYLSDAKSSQYSVKVSSPVSNTKQSTLTLNTPKSAFVGEIVKFTGQLTSNGRPINNAFIEIKEDDPGPDQRLGSIRTDSNGEFSFTWRAESGTIEREFEIYAVFEGNSDYKKKRSVNQEITITKRGGSITLDSLPNSARIGEQIIFTGTLYLDSISSKGAIVYIKDDDVGPDDLLATGYVDRNGKFSANWIVKNVDSVGKSAEIYAVFEGNDVLERLTTCKTLCKRDIVKLQILDPLPPSTIPPPTTPPSYKTTDEYMKLYYSLDLSHTPRVAIIPDPDSYADVRGHIGSVQEGLRMWESYLEPNYGGVWDVEYEIFQPGKLFFDSEPDIIMNLVKYDDDDGKNGCDDYYGVARWIEGKLTNTTVCSYYNGERRANESVVSTTAHELIHAMGLGHTFNRDKDLMCSVEENVETCATRNKSKTPSALNLEAVRAIYGADGFQNPNNNIIKNEKFRLDNSNKENSNYNPPTPKSNVYCEQTYDNYDWTITNKVLKPGWYIPWKICSNSISFSFITDSKSDGFHLFILPPETNVKDFISNRDGKYYTCEKYEQAWHQKSNICHIKPGSHIVLQNIMDDSIRVDGYILNR